MSAKNSRNRNLLKLSKGKLQKLLPTTTRDLSIRVSQRLVPCTVMRGQTAEWSHPESTANLLKGKPQLPLHGSFKGKLCNSENVVGIMPVPVPVIRVVPAEAPAVPVADAMLVVEAPKCIESVLKTIMTVCRQLLLKGSIPKIEACKLVLTKE